MTFILSVREDKKISRATLERELGEHAHSVLKLIDKKKYTHVPDIENLFVGDIILTRGLGKDGKPKPHIVEIYQQKELGFTPEDAFWCHAMVYIGNMHVVESTKKIHWTARGFRTGPRISNLMDFVDTCKLKVCRSNQLKLFWDLRHNIGRTALIDISLNRRFYSRSRLWDLVRNAAKRPDLKASVICSEYALQLLATGASCMTEEYEALGTESFKYYLPGDFHRSEKFEKMDLTLLKYTAS